ncbi:MAG: DUF983 domain-containing protein [Inquilinus sp.]|uniref:DUF983 domain-containing protein n=1 Tax=Inquilinus sp. TaxID=1932117 RepID=UPI003F2E68E3
MAQPTFPTLKPFQVGIRARCPRCGKGHLFRGFLTLAPNCAVCGLDYGFADPADGPAFFVISIISFPVIAFAAWLELAYEPPMWVHLLTSVPLLIGGCLALLRPLKGWLVAAQYINDAREARLTTNSKIDDRAPAAESQQEQSDSLIG